VTPKIFDVLGREVATLVSGVEEPGHKSVWWGASSAANGSYFYQLDAGDFVATKKNDFVALDIKQQGRLSFDRMMTRRSIGGDGQ